MAELEKPLGVFSIIIIAFLTLVVVGVMLGTFFSNKCAAGGDFRFDRFDEICKARSAE